MPVMNIRIMGMAMCHRLMLMRMTMWLCSVPIEIMCMLVMRVMEMFMVMFHSVMRMGMFMVLG